MEEMIGWIVSILIFQGIGAFIAKKKKDKGRQDPQSNQPQTQTQSQQQQKEEPQKSHPLSAFFERLEEASRESASPEVEEVTLKSAFESKKSSYYKDPYKDSENSEDTEYEFDEEWVTRDRQVQPVGLSQAPLGADLAMNAAGSKHLNGGPSYFMKQLRKRPLVQQGVIMKEILDTPPGLR